MLTAKIENDGDEQILVFPEGFRFDCDEVMIEKAGSCFILQPASGQSTKNR